MIGLSGYTEGAVGWKTDSHSNTGNILATVNDDTNNIKCDIVYHKYKNSHIISTGSMIWNGSLLIDTNISKISKNIINAFLINDIDNYNNNEIMDMISI